MKTDKQIYTLLGADADFLRVLTDGIAVRGPYLFEALDVKGLERRTDGVLIPRALDQDISVVSCKPAPCRKPRVGTVSRCFNPG